LLATLQVGEVVCIFYLIGLIMFLLPPVPGVPVYITGGVVLVQKFRGTCAGDAVSGKPTGECDGPMDFGTALIVTSFICFLIKLNAVAMQQKGFGEGLGRYTSIRVLVGINSPLMRAIKIILSKPGLNMGKVSILCGGPDWPTSVITGILGLPLSQMLLGSLPVYFVILPCVLAGGFQLRKEDGPMYESLASVAIMLATVCQLVAGMLAVFYVERCTRSNKAIIEAMPDDQEVLKVEEKQKKRAKVYHSITDWNKKDFPSYMKVLLVIGALCMTLFFSLTGIAGSMCFKDFQVTDTIATKLASEPGLQDGKVLNIILFYGYIALALFGVAVVVLVVFTRWAGRKVKHGLYNFKQLGSRVQLMNKAANAFEKHDDGDGDVEMGGGGGSDPRCNDERFDATATFLKEQKQKQDEEKRNNNNNNNAKNGGMSRSMSTKITQQTHNI